MTDRVRILGISGSLRRSSFNSGLLRAAQEAAGDAADVTVADIRGVPLYDNDVYETGFPPAVAAFRDQIAAADALLFACPEYNYSMSGVLKNAIDWASRPPSQPFAGKPVAIMGASGGAMGTARAQYHLRQSCVFLDMHPLNKPELMVAAAGPKFDASGNLTDEETRTRVGALVEALAAWARRLKG